ncbi:MAG: hypothetical protein RIS90_767 [Pseudomonadota bacterium]|jgi:hypothetical protein
MTARGMRRLRVAVLLLLLGNLVYFVWSEGLLRGAGLGPAVQNEPQRLLRQIRPEALRLQPNAAETVASPLEPALMADQSGPCLQAGLFDEAQSQALQTAAGALLPAGSWTLSAATEPARWIVYIGQYSSPLTIDKKRAELLALKFSVEPLTNPDLELGLSLGHFETQAAAMTELEALKKRGLRKALVVQEHPERRGMALRVRLSDKLPRSQLEGLKPMLVGKAWVDCH